MQDTTQTNWRRISRGYAGENLALGSKDLEVFIPEFSGFTEGEITSDLVPISASGESHDGSRYDVQILTSNTISATWRQDGTNRITPPNIRRGEVVDVWQYGTTDKYFWTVSGESDSLRRLETVTWAFSNTTDESTEELDEDNTYNFQISTHKKQVNFNTSQSNGEPFTHHIQLDTKLGNFHYRDSAGNYIQVESGSNRIIVQNAAGSIVDAHEENISVSAPNDINIDCTNLNINADNITEKTTNKKTTASNITEKASQKNVTAQVSIKGNVGVAGNLGINGTSTMTGNMNIIGDLRNNGVNVGSTHTHGGVDRGGSSTNTPN